MFPWLSHPDWIHFCVPSFEVWTVVVMNPVYLPKCEGCLFSEPTVLGAEIRLVSSWRARSHAKPPEVEGKAERTDLTLMR